MSNNIPNATPMSRGVRPKQGKQLKLTIPFFSQSISTYTTRLAVSETSQNIHNMDNIRSVFVDNSQNANNFTLSILDTGQLLVCPPYAQAIFPIYFGTLDLQFNASLSAATADVTCIFTNTNEDAMLWSTRSISAGSTAVTVSNPFVTVSPYNSATVDKSGAISIGGTAITAANANSSRKRFMIMNGTTAGSQNIAAAESLFFSFTGTANLYCGGGTYELPPGASWDSGAGSPPLGAFSVNGATAAHRFTASEMT